eukprot:1157231-Pelagomonas_calceolata.AAC.1
MLDCVCQDHYNVIQGLQGVGLQPETLANRLLERKGREIYRKRTSCSKPKGRKGKKERFKDVLPQAANEEMMIKVAAIQGVCKGYKGFGLQPEALADRLQEEPSDKAHDCLGNA